MSGDFYHAFEERFRGSRELILSRLRFYIPFLMPFKQIYDECRVIDLGCGRGEWLELMREIDFQALGVDINENMVADCRERSLAVEMADAVEFLRSLPDESHVVVSAFHLVEHLPFSFLHTLTKEALRVLKPCGLLILETPNPQNILVGSAEFYLDPTHQRPIPPGLLAFIAEYYGFSQVKIVYLQEPQSPISERTSILDVLGGVSRDYAVVAQKAGNRKNLDLFSKVFEQNYGVSLQDAARRYDENQSKMARLEAGIAAERARAQQLEALWREAAAQSQSLAEQLALLRDEAQRTAQSLHQEHSQKVQISQELLDTQNLLAAERSRAQTLADEAESLRKERDNLAGEIVQARQKEENLARALGQAEKNICSLSHNIENLKAETVWLRNELDQWRVKAEGYQSQLKCVYQSYSWRITYPLRSGLNLLFLCKRSFVQTAQGLWRIIIFIPKSLLTRLMRFALRVPWLRAQSNKLIGRFPSIHAFLYEFALSHGVNATSIPVIRAFSSDGIAARAGSLSVLPPRARKIYVSLRKAISDGGFHPNNWEQENLPPCSWDDGA